MYATKKHEVAANGRKATPERPNRMIAVARFVGNTIKEAFVHPLSTSVIDMNTGKVIARDGKKVS